MLRSGGGFYLINIGRGEIPAVLMFLILSFSLHLYCQPDEAREQIRLSISVQFLIWYDTMWYDIWRDIWYDMIYVIWYMTCYMIWYDIWYDMIYVIWYMTWYMICYDIYDMIWYMIWYDMIWYDTFNCNWVTTRWQYITHIHKNNREKDTKQTIHKTTQKLRRVRAMSRLCGFYPGICLTTEEKAMKNLSQGSHT